MNLPLFDKDDTEFKESREALASLIEEYKHAEQDDYIQWMQQQQ